MNGELRIQLLGELSITLDSIEIHDFRSMKTKLLFCYLCLSKQRHTRKALAGLFWSELSEENASVNLRMAIANLKTHFSTYLIINRQTISFNEALPHSVDVVQFQTLVGQVSGSNKQIDLFTEALKYYKGEFLSGIYLEDAPLFEEWMLNRRERLAGQVAQILTWLSDFYSNRGNHVNAIKSLGQLLEIEPWNEEAHRLLMINYYRSGKRSAALAHYDKCKKLLDSRLDVEPSEKTKLLRDRIKLATDPPNNLLSIENFVGRKVEIETVSEILVGERMVSLVGIGGIGKTRLAIEVARNQRYYFLDGIWLIDFSKLEDASSLLPFVSNSLELKNPAVNMQSLVKHLKDKQTLLLLDNCEHIIKSVAHLVDHLLINCPEIKIMTTSREPLKNVAEVCWHAPPLRLPQHEPKQDEFANYDALNLFLSLHRKNHPEFTLNATNANTIFGVCSQLDGLPLAIELAVSQAKGISLLELEKRLG